ncbi:MAG TPA: D-2-hydroxyacid dehydrogenase [Methylomirabilota bacterium]|nr:D-2-hydroxyacid dehydrogenase [Methylomirabilota bacterium]
MKIVVLDGHTLNPGDLSWETLEALGECAIHDRTPAERVVERASGAEIVLTNKTPVSAEAIGKLETLRYIGVLATGYNIVDVEAARRRKIPVTNVPSYGTRSVAQMTFALLLELTQRVGDHARGVREGGWARCPDFSYWEHPLIELEGLTMGIIGYGRIGRAVGELARAFGMKVLAHKPTPPREVSAGVRFAGLEEVFSQSDVVSLHCPLTEETRHLVNRERLARMKSSAFLLNTSRGPLVDEEALAEALKAGRLAGAGLDVLSREPPPAEHPLYGARNCFITPHIAWATRAARIRLLSEAVENVRAYLRGESRNVVG